MGALLRTILIAIGAALFAGISTAPAPGAIRPDPAEAAADKPAGYKNGCHLNQKTSTPKACAYGDTKARRTITLVGDSKARQWLPTLDRYGKAKKWRIVAHTKSACSFSQASLSAGSSKRYTSCIAWNDKVLSRIKRDKPRIVVVALYNKYARKTPGARTSEQRKLAMVKGLRSSWRSLTRSGIGVVVLNSSPYIGTPYKRHPRWQAPDCVAAHRKNPGVCAVPASDALSGQAVWTPQERARVLQGLARVNLVDLNSTLCGTRTCPVVIRNILVYRDNHHLTATFARSLYPHLRNRLAPLL